MTETATRTVERALALLGVVCDAGAVPLAGAAREAKLSSSTALRLLRTLENSGFVRKGEDGDYRPGLRLVQVGAQALRHESLISLAAPALNRLMEETGESAYLSVLGHHGTGKDHAVYLSIAEGTHSVRHISWVGRSVPLDGSSLGVVFAGNTPQEGYAVSDRGVEADVTAIAAPLNLPGTPKGAEPVAAISVVAPSYRMDAVRIEQVGQLVAAEALALFEQGIASDEPARSMPAS